MRRTAPSSDRRVDLGGMLPGVMPPTSAWWPRLATKNMSSSPSKTGVITVKSGRCDPPASCGWLETSTSPSRSPSRPGCDQWDSWKATADCMAPRCTGRWGALATRPPSGPNTTR